MKKIKPFSQKEKTMMWITVLWFVFFAGPGAVLFSTTKFILGLPALWTFSLVAWFISIYLVYWWGYKARVTNVSDYED